MAEHGEDTGRALAGPNIGHGGSNLRAVVEYETMYE